VAVPQAMDDSDICLAPNWLATCLSHLERYDVVGGTALPDGDITYIYVQFHLVRWALLRQQGSQRTTACTATMSSKAL